MGRENNIVELVDLIDKHMQETPVIIDYQRELDMLKQKYKQLVEDREFYEYN